MRKRHDKVQEGIRKYTESVNTNDRIKAIQQLASYHIEYAIEATALDISSSLEKIRRSKHRLSSLEQTEVAITTLRRLIALDACILRAIPRHPENCVAIKAIHHDILTKLSPLVDKAERQLIVQSLKTIDHYATGSRSSARTPCYKVLIKPLNDIHIDHRKKSYDKTNQLAASQVTNSITRANLFLLNHDLVNYLTLDGINQRRQLTAKILQTIISTYLKLDDNKQLHQDDATTLLTLIHDSYRELNSQTSWLDRIRGNRLGKLLERHLSRLPKKIPSTMKLSLDAAEILGSGIKAKRINPDDLPKRYTPDSLRAANHLSKTVFISKNKTEKQKNKLFTKIKLAAESKLKAQHSNLNEAEITSTIERIDINDILKNITLLMQNHNMKPLNDKQHDNLLALLVYQHAEGLLFREEKNIDEVSAHLRFKSLRNLFASSTEDFIKQLPKADANNSAHNGINGWSQQQVCVAIFEIYGTQPLKLHFLAHLKDAYTKNLTGLAATESGERVLLAMQSVYETLKPDRREDSSSLSEKTKEKLLAQVANIPVVQDKLTAGIISMIKRLLNNFKTNEITSSSFLTLKDKLNNLFKLVKACKLDALQDTWSDIIKNAAPLYEEAQLIQKELTGLEYTITSTSPQQFVTVDKFIEKRDTFFLAIERFDETSSHLMHEQYPEQHVLHRFVTNIVIDKYKGVAFGKALAEWTLAYETLNEDINTLVEASDDTTFTADKAPKMYARIEELQLRLDKLERENPAYSSKIDRYRHALPLDTLKSKMADLEPIHHNTQQTGNPHTLFTHNQPGNLPVKASKMQPPIPVSA